MSVSNSIASSKNVKTEATQTSLHAISMDSSSYIVGINMVIKRGDFGQIQASYTNEDGHGIHSVWNISKDGSCQSSWVLIRKAYPSWGDYLTPGADYCMKVTTF